MGRVFQTAVLLAVAVGAQAQDAPRTWTVSPAQSIQQAIDNAAPGDTVQVLPGEYVESLTITKDRITLKGLEYEGERTTLKSRINEEDEPLESAIVIGANQVIVEGFVIRAFGQFGIVADNCAELTLRDLIVEDAGVAGVQLDDIRQCAIERVTSGRNGGAAVSIQDSTECRIVQTEGYGSRFGLYIQDSQQIVIDNGSFHHNGIGVVFVGSTDDPAKRLAYVKMLRTRVIGNNAAIPALQGLHLADAPPGTGILIAGATELEIAQGDISENGSMGVMTLAFDANGVRHRSKDIARSGPPAEHVYMHHNHYANNGRAPSPGFTAQFAGVAPGDIYWDELGERNQFQETGDLQTHPPKLVVEQGGVHTNVIHFQ